MRYSSFLILFFALSFCACTQAEKQSTDNTASKATAKKEALPKGATSTKSTISSDLPRVTYKELESRDVNGKTVMHKDDKPYNGVAFSTYSNAQVFTEQEYRNGLKIGGYATWYPDGKPKTSGALNANGKEEGEIKQWYENGQLKHIWIFKNGLKDGQWAQWYESGQKWTQRDFDNGVLNGKVYVWGEDGVLGKEYTYVNGNMTEKLNHFENF